MSRLLPPLLLLTFWSACPPLQRLNADCEWTNDAPMPLNTRKSGDARHLKHDALIAEELAIRYADVKRGHRSGHFVGTDEYVQTRERCLASLLGIAAIKHGIRAQEMGELVGLREADFDFAVLLSFAVLYTLACNVFSGWLVVRFPSDEHLAAVTATTMSAMTSAGGLMMFGLWASSWEMIRVADLHMSYRVARSPWSQHRTELLVAGVGLFVAMALLRYLKPRATAD
jgi:hypothetical protein